MRRAALLAAAFVVQAGSAHAFTAQDAADCAAFSYANWDYEVQNFDPADLSPLVKDQATAFRSLATRLGLSEAEADARVTKMRPAFLNVVNSFIFEMDATAEAQFIEISNLCATILDSAPELVPYR